MVSVRFFSKLCASVNSDVLDEGGAVATVTTPDNPPFPACADLIFIWISVRWQQKHVLVTSLLRCALLVTML